MWVWLRWGHGLRVPRLCVDKHILLRGVVLEHQQEQLLLLFQCAKMDIMGYTGFDWFFNMHAILFDLVIVLVLHDPIILLQRALDAVIDILKQHGGFSCHHSTDINTLWSSAVGWLLHRSLHDLQRRGGTRTRCVYLRQSKGYNNMKVRVGLAMRYRILALPGMRSLHKLRPDCSVDLFIHVRYVRCVLNHYIYI